MFSFGNTSMKHYHTLSYNLQWILREALAFDLMDFSIVCGFRDRDDQNKAFSEGKSKVKWPHGKHNKVPSIAADCVPYVDGKISWNKLHCCVLAGIILTTAKKLGIPIRWGGNWDMDGEPITDQDFQDLTHFEET